VRAWVLADAVDEPRHFYELNVYAGAEPDDTRLTDSEVHRALSSPHFFLVVSGVEDGRVEHRVRVIAKPPKQVQKLDHHDMRLGGVRSRLPPGTRSRRVAAVGDPGGRTVALMLRLSPVARNFPSAVPPRYTACRLRLQRRGSELVTSVVDSHHTIIGTVACLRLL